MQFYHFDSKQTPIVQKKQNYFFAQVSYRSNWQYRLCRVVAAVQHKQNTQCVVESELQDISRCSP